MIATSELYERLYRGDYTVEYKALIDGVEYGMRDIISVRRTNSLFTEFGIGNANAGQVELQFKPKRGIPYHSKIELSLRITHGADASEWLPAGHYYFSRRRTDMVNGVMSVTGFDPMLKADGTFLDGAFDGYDWPMPASKAVELIAARIGVAVDPRTRVNPSYRITCPIQVDANGNENGSFPSMRDVLRWIAVASAGNFTITAAGELLLVVASSQPEPSSTLTTEKGVDIIFGDSLILIGEQIDGAYTGGMGETYVGTRLNEAYELHTVGPVSGVHIVRTGLTIDENADPSTTVYVANTGKRFHSRPDCGVGGFSSTTLGDAMERGMTPCQNCGGSTYEAGDDSGYVLHLEHPDATQDMADHILSQLDGYIYRPYDGTDAILNPAAELGDGITVCGIYSVLASYDIPFDGLYAGNLAAPTSDNSEDEYPYIPRLERDLKKVKEEVDDIRDRIEDLENGGSGGGSGGSGGCGCDCDGKLTAIADSLDEFKDCCGEVKENTEDANDKLDRILKILHGEDDPGPTEKPDRPGGGGGGGDGPGGVGGGSYDPFSGIFTGMFCAVCHFEGTSIEPIVNAGISPELEAALKG